MSTRVGEASSGPSKVDQKRTPASLRTIAMPADTNPNGDIFGGWLLSQMDLAGGTYAFFKAQGRVATVAITGMKFHKPVNVGDEVSCYCATERIGKTSITVQVETWVRRRRQAVEEQVTEGLFTFVALDAEGNPREIENPDNEFARTRGVVDEPHAGEARCERNATDENGTEHTGVSVGEIRTANADGESM